MHKKKKLRLKTALFKGAYIHNTVLTALSGLCPIAAVCTTAKNALMLCAVYSVTLILCEFAASAFFKRYARWIRVCLYALMSSAGLFVSSLCFDAKALSALGVYLPLLCVSGVTVIRCEKFAVKTAPVNALIDALASSVGFSVVALLVGAVRELIAQGSLFGIQTDMQTIGAVAMPFGGFLVLGFLAAVHKWSVIRFFPGEIVDTFNMSHAQERPVLKDPGLGKEKKPKQKRQSLSKEREEYEKIRPRYNIEDIETEDKP